MQLAASDACPIQAIRHKAARSMALQFHPERYTDVHPDGRTILTNFFQLAGSTAHRSGAAALARA